MRFFVFLNTSIHAFFGITVLSRWCCMTIYSAHKSKRRNSTKLFGCDHHIPLSLYYHVNTFITSYINSLKWLMHSRAHMWWNSIQTCRVYVPACVLIYITPMFAIKLFLYVNIRLQSYVCAIRIHWSYNNVKPLIITTGETAHKTLGRNNVNEQNITGDMSTCMCATAVEESNGDVLCGSLSDPNSSTIIRVVRFGCLLS